MRNVFVAFSCLLCLALAQSVYAAVQTFGPDFARFNILVPDGWSAVPNDGGCQITSGDGKTSISVQIQKNGGKTSKELAELIGSQIGGKIISIEEEGPNQTGLYAEINGTRVGVLIIVVEDKFVAFTMAGSDVDSLKKIAESFSDAQ